MCSCSDLILCDLLVVFFFQAEDGIRDLVRSRGLGDVYKRQTMPLVIEAPLLFMPSRTMLFRTVEAATLPGIYAPVSYTHLTLPTSDLV